MRTTLPLLAALAASALTLSQLPAADPVTGMTDVTWKRTAIEEVFRSEGVAVADVNKDGKLDILNGECWYEAPTWKRHDIRKPGDYKNGQGNYSDSFCCWPEDLNGDGYPDLIVINFPGNPCHWFENPKGKDGLWKKHEIWHSACNETPQYVDLFGTGKKVLVMGFQPKDSTKGNMGRMAYFTPDPTNPTKPWVMHPISEESKPGKEVPGTQKFSHGLGVGDLNGDGKLDVLCAGGWWEQPAKVEDGTPWKFHPLSGIDAVADMHAVDVTGDGKADILCSSAHRFGIWSFDQRPSKTPGESPAFVKRDLFPMLLSETHALVKADVNGDGVPDLVTGKRWWSHGRSEPGSDWPAMVYWFEGSKSKDGAIRFTPRVVDTDSGVGTQFTVIDVNGDGLLDVVTSNKRGTFLFEQGRKAKK